MVMTGRGVSFEAAEDGALQGVPVISSAANIYMAAKNKVIPESVKPEFPVMRVKKLSDLGVLGDPSDDENEAARMATAVYRNIECPLWIHLKSDEFEVSDYNVIDRVQAPKSQIIAPGLSADASHSAVLKEKAKARRAIFTSDTPEDKTQATEYVNTSLSSEWAYAVYDQVKIHKNWPWVPASALVAGHNEKAWREHGFHTSPSNRVVNGALEFKNGTQWSFSDQNSESTEINKKNLNMLVYTDHGIRLWGNRLSDGSFINARTTFRAIINAIEKWAFRAVDRSIDRYFVSYIRESLLEFFRGLEEEGQIIGYNVVIPPGLNTPNELMAGRFTIDFEYMYVPVAEHIKFRYTNNPEYLKMLFAA